MRKYDKKELVKQFAEAVVAQTNEIMAGNAIKSNKYANIYIKCAKKLFQLGEEGKEELSTLLSHSNPDVRSEAAAYLLKYKTEEALEVLREVAKLNNFYSFCAQEAIKRWEEGTWHLDEFD